ncbi:DUF4407 domain-containing protein [Nonomuraea sp. PA05]|uniref:DUF4407 domain-containing protein n=1 Tax=Nonomuraea sp. PA05 TaxID=2604466 RepID=UPI0011DAFEF8|nr:DUF4407 domain-containing protein [Nonomuraea sp. PA05]TYB54738.1 DUF4407 domain-containing protein [Nonomuraea sp. PA05]
MTQPRGVSRLLSRLAGADESVLRQIPSERPRFIQMALVLLTTALIAVVSMTFAMHDGLDVPMAVAVLIGIVWGFMIINLDRMLVLGIGSSRTRGRLLALALPRLFIALIISMVVSTPLVLRIFDTEVELKIHKNQLAESAWQKEREGNSFEKQRKTDLEAKIATAKDTLGGKLPQTVTTPRLQAARERVDDLTKDQDKKRAARDRKYEEWQCELYGQGPRCHRATDLPGPGPLAEAKKRQYDAAQRAYAKVTGKLATANASVRTAQNEITNNRNELLVKAQQQARTDLVTWEKQLAEINTVLKSRADEGTRINTANNNISAQIQALFQLSEEDGALGTMHLVLFLLFVLFEMLPVTVKVLMNLGPITPYETEVQLRDNSRIIQSEAYHDVDRIIAQDRAQVRTEIEKDMRQREKQLGLDVNKYVAKEMQTVIGRSLHDWSTRLQTALPSNASTAQANGNNAPPTIQLRPVTPLPDENDL